MPAKNSGFCGGSKISRGKSRFSKNSHGFNGEISSHSSGMQKPRDSTDRFTILKSLMIENKPIVTRTSFGSGAQSSPPMPWRLRNRSSAASSTARASTSINGSAFLCREQSSSQEAQAAAVYISILTNKSRFHFT